ncbi:ROK family protein [Aeromicrobium sp. CTD01-1L150]|uniref:ROK family transcriptional regulator n=1 Tax=Aeromicrobium sp. CTD01-1L150 TaxID=3341830 RepID=UPI0035C17773
MTATTPPAASGSDPLARASRSGEVLRLIRTGAATTISELATAMNVARSTVTDRVDLLTDIGMIVPRTGFSTGRGRPATVFAFRTDSRLALTAQVGMSGVRLGLADMAGNILTTHTHDLALAEGPEALFDALQAGFSRLLDAAERTVEDVVGVGVGLPGRIELETTEGLGASSTRPWLSHSLKSWLEDLYDVPVCVDRGVNLLSNAEHRSFHPSAEILLGLKVGTVIECGIVVAAKTVTGGSGIAGEIGHTRVPGSEAPCACGNRGCLNAVASGAALAEQLNNDDLPVRSARDVADMAANGHFAATSALRSAGRAVGEVVAGAVNLLNPDIIVVWGYLADGGDHLIAGLREGLYRGAVPAASRHVVIEPARLGDDAALRGAATAVVEQALTPERVDRQVPIDAARRGLQRA